MKRNKNRYGLRSKDFELDIKLDNERVMRCEGLTFEGMKKKFKELEKKFN